MKTYQYNHGQTSYNELTQFGPSQVVDELSCDSRSSDLLVAKKITSQPIFFD
jgi:hypothetical protein